MDPENDINSFLKMEIDKKNRGRVELPADCLNGKAALMTGDHTRLLSIGDASVRMRYISGA